MKSNLLGDTKGSSAKARLAALNQKGAPTKAAHIRRLWPEINAALSNGHSLRAVCDCLEADGIRVSVQALGSYITRMRRRGPDTPPSRATDAPSSAPTTAPNDGRAAEKAGQPDPLANVRQSQAKRPKFEYRPELADPDKLI